MDMESKLSLKQQTANIELYAKTHMLAYSQPRTTDTRSLEPSPPNDRWSICQPALKTQTPHEENKYLSNENNPKQQTYSNNEAKSFMAMRKLLNLREQENLYQYNTFCTQCTVNKIYDFVIDAVARLSCHV